MRNKGFTLLEVLVTLALISIVFTMIGSVYVNTFRGMGDFIGNTESKSIEMSLYNQLNKQLFSNTVDANPRIYLKDNFLSFYTNYPVFYSGSVRAVYHTENKGNKVMVIYEEFPYIDNNLHGDGTKKYVIGSADSINFTVYDNDKWQSDYENKVLPKAVKVEINKEEYIVAFK